MLTYADVLNAPVDKVKTAVDDWSEMATRLRRLAGEAHDGMRAHAERASWAGVNAGVTRDFITRTAKEFDDAAKEAAGVHQVLLDGYGAFKKAKDELQSIVDEAGRSGIAIDASGTVTARHPLQDDVAARHDPDYPQALEKQTSAIEAWQKRVTAAVETCADADESLRLALSGNVTDAHDFSAPKYASLADEEAARAADLAKKVTGPGGTARNVEALKQLQELMDDHRGEPGFATSFYRRMGAEGTLEFYSRLSLDATGLGPAGADRAASVLRIQDDMGPMLGLATNPRTPGHLDANWTLDLMRAGRKPMDVSRFAGVTTKVYGYQALGALLRHGTYDREFLLPVARDMVGFEHQNPKAFQQAMPYNNAMAFNLDKDGGRGFDPLTGLMTAMSNNPQVASEFFNEPVRQDSDGNGIITKDDKPVTVKDDKGVSSSLGMVDYLLDKDPADDWYDTPRGTGAASTPFQSAMGNALEAAVTGRTPGDTDAKPVQHTAAMSHVMEKVVEKIGSDPGLVKEGDDGTPGKLSGLVGHFGDMAAEYMPDLQAISENGAQQAKPFGVLAEFKMGNVGRFLAAVAQDPGAYGAITNAQQAYTTLLVRDVFAHPELHGHDVGEAVRNAVHPGGLIAGMMAEARVEAVWEKHAAEDEEFNKAIEDKSKWTNRIIDSFGGKYIELLPAGDAVEWLKEDISERLVDEAQQDSSDKAGKEATDGYLNAESGAKKAAANAVHSAGRSAGLGQRDIAEYAGTASTSIANAYADGHAAATTAAPRGGKK
ncbi:DUF6571 family protein [Streptomyces sp. NBC_00083]|uniref:DUF6571 family protein n=1 Tax=Streptomyces sp. NBC_00083 TaxID=2975647 RepID=UPI0022549461|nr:DUF6571 family protein [Streptomyces sp. NBC_00083]MCX5382163.1 hypothetical protein [Streptomyces sp. NBC_00083]